METENKAKKAKYHPEIKKVKNISISRPESSVHPPMEIERVRN
jgi:hypothetical protein